MTDNLTGDNKSMWKIFQMIISIAIVIIYCIEPILYVYTFTYFRIPVAYYYKSMIWFSLENKSRTD